jgi:hypothetical protein
LKHDVAIAAQEEREAQAALFGKDARGLRDAASDDDDRRSALLARWQAAAHALAAALENLERAQRPTAPVRQPGDTRPPHT